MTAPSSRAAFNVLVLVAVGMACGRILAAQLVYEPAIHRDETEPPGKRLWPKKLPKWMPTFGSNDRSRWATVRSLVDDKTYAIGKRDRKVVIASAVAPLGTQDAFAAAAVAFLGQQARIGKQANTGIIFQDGWESVDKVLNPATLEYYSSKPPFLATLIAGLYWLLQFLFGWTFETHPGAIVRTILLIVNAGTFWLYLRWLVEIVERLGATDWARWFVLAAGAFATLMTPFQVTLNNHTLATVCVLGATVNGIRIWQRAAGERVSGWRCFAAAGFLAAVAATNEMPALAFAAALFLVLLLLAPVRTLFLFLPPALLVAGAFFYTNYRAVGSWRPVNTEFGSPWYYYEGSHFRPPNPNETRRGIDFARYQETRGEYAFHLLLGHHGWFSLTPIWLLVLWNLFLGSRRDSSILDQSDALRVRLREFIVLTQLISCVVIGFYIWKTDNYGGWTIGPRWLMWLTPLWLISLLPVLDRMAPSRLGRGIACLFLLLSALSANYSLWNAWRHPWIYDAMLALGWPGY